MSKAQSVLNAGADEQWTFCPADVAALLAPPEVDAAGLPIRCGVGAPSAVSGTPCPRRCWRLLDRLILKLRESGQRVRARQHGHGQAGAIDEPPRRDGDGCSLMKVVAGMVKGMPLVIPKYRGRDPTSFRLVTLLPEESTPVRKFIESVAPTPFYLRPGEKEAFGRGRSDRRTEN